MLSVEVLDNLSAYLTEEHEMRSFPAAMRRLTFSIRYNKSVYTMFSYH